MNGSGSYSRSPHHRGRGYNSYYHETPALIKLHNEMVSFVKLMEPTREELEVRDQMVERVTDLAKRTFGKRVSPFCYVSFSVFTWMSLTIDGQSILFFADKLDCCYSVKFSPLDLK